MTVKPILYEHDGEALSIRAWAERLGVHQSVLRKRLSAGETIGEAIVCQRPIGRPPSRATGIEAVDPTKPYSEDLACQRFVAAHPGGATLDDVGKVMGVTRERIRQIEAKALRNLRRRLRLAGVRLEDLETALRSSNWDHTIDGRVK